MNTIIVGLMGLGNVGTGVWNILHMNQKKIKVETGSQIMIKRVLVQRINKERAISLPPECLTADAQELLGDPEIDIVIELIGGIEPAKAYIVAAIEAGKHVITANKALMAQWGDYLLEKARKKGVFLYFEGSVAGGIPIIGSIQESLTANEIYEIKGIINGTTNYILTKMSLEDADYETALGEAQAKGYAEADPTSDVDGYDAAYKLSILSHLAFHTPLPSAPIFQEGIRKISPLDIQFAQELGYRIKLLAIGKSRKDGVELRVHPTMIPLTHPLAAVHDSYNAIYLKGNAVGELMYYGRGAGELPTGSAVMGDLISLIKKIHCPYFDTSAHWQSTPQLNPMKDTLSEYYIRLVVRDIPGVLGKVASLFGQHQVSISRVIQKNPEGSVASLVIFTHLSRESDVQNTLAGILSIPEVKEVSNLIRVEQ